MKLKSTLLLAIIGCALLTHCKEKKSNVQLEQAYLVDLNEWREKLNKRRVVYLELCGLYKMTKSDLVVGIDSSNTFSNDPSKIKTPIGTFKWSGEHYNFESNILSNVRNSSGETIDHKQLILDHLGDSELLFYNTFKWRIITRSGAPYLRIWNKENPAISAFDGFNYFQANPNFIFEAEFKYFEKTKSESVASKLGIDDDTSFVGQVSFKYDNKIHTLDVGPDGWIMVADATSGDKTYGAGRYMYVNLPKEDGVTRLDFNKLYNPPCRYSKYTTCLFPPRQNVLSFEIRAGELNDFNK
ncbi:MAG: DUF1684 domain-containing protein [Flavobacteriaceae bacterium]